MPPQIREFWKTRAKLRCVENVPMYDEKTVIPKRLREEVKKTLHSAHQGVLSMSWRAEESVFWPNTWTDLEKIRQSCHTCHKIAPTQANLLPVEPIAPD